MGGENMEKKQENRRIDKRLFGRSIRRIPAVLSVFVIGALFTAMPCMAAETNIVEQSGGSASKNVYARYESSGEDGIASSPVTDGTASVTLADGTVITVSGVTADGLYLKVFAIPKETDSSSAWQWFTAQMEGKGTNMRPYDIWFEDTNGQVQEVGGTIGIAITPPSGAGYQNPVVYYQPSQGSPEKMNASYAGGTVSFQTTHNSYYVLLEQSAQGGTVTEEPTQTPTEKPTQTPTGTTDSKMPQGTADSGKETPKTGDSSDIYPWMITFVVSLSAAGGIVFLQYRKKKHHTK